MCDIKKLCTCDEVVEGQNHWRLEALTGFWPSWGSKFKARPEYQKQADEQVEAASGIMGPMPMPQFTRMFEGIADPDRLERVVKEEEKWLNKENQFDFDYTPFKDDNLVYVMDGKEVAFRYYEDKGWKYFPEYHKVQRDHRGNGRAADDYDNKIIDSGTTR